MPSTNCVPCNRSFQTHEAFLQHCRDSPAHLSDTNNEDQDFTSDLYQVLARLGLLNSSSKLQPSEDSEHSEYKGVPSDLIDPVFRKAKQLRYSKPQEGTIIAMTKTTLDKDIVTNLIRAAQRLVPKSSDPELRALEVEKENLTRQRAASAEAAFVEAVRKVHPDLEEQAQQLAKIREAIEKGEVENLYRATPDIRFPTPRMICGVSCSWIEYKWKFGFKADPFLYRPACRQFRKYADGLGSGIVVYSLGFEMGLVDIEGVHCYREMEITNWLVSRG